MESKNNRLRTRIEAYANVLVFIALVALFIVALRDRWFDAWLGVTADTEIAQIENVQKVAYQANIGAYDPEEHFAHSTSLAIGHIFIQWNAFSAFDLEKNINEIIHKKRWPLITVEPFVRDGEHPLTLLADITHGAYDDVIRNVCGVFAKVNHSVFVRWGHEMEIVNGRYPWATNDSQAFIAAYQRMVVMCRAENKNIYFVWSPAGDPKLSIYWPGGKYVDYIGLSVYGYPLWDEIYYGHKRSFQEIFDEKYALVSSFNKPIMIAELGVTGDADFQKKWLLDAYRVLDTYSLLKTVVYFNSKDHAGVWGSEVPTPDWRIDPELFEK